ncbi:MAG: class I SAM-dependent methyltransferase [Chloroflexota bacterium]|nr:class I SAM-dependent methyltransferase [Chloroflexota bacterium]
MLLDHPNQVTNYAWFLSLLWFGRCGDWSMDPYQYLAPRSHHLVEDLVRQFHAIVAVWPDARGQWHPSDMMLERMVEGVRRAMSFGSSLSEYLRLARQVPVGGRIAEIGSYEGGSVVPVAISVLHREVIVYSVESFTGDLDGGVDGTPLPRTTAYLENLHGRYPHLRLVSTPGRSCDVSRMFPDAFFDLIFIDAAHDAVSVEHDLRHWLPKLRPGGTLAGDDWDWPSVRQGVLAVFDEADVSSAHSVWSVLFAGDAALRGLS